MVGWIEAITLLQKVDFAITRERPCKFADVAFGVVSLPEREEFKKLAGEVLVGLGLGAVQPVEPAEHGTVAQDLAMQLADRVRESWRNAWFCSSMSSGELILAWLVA